jgi:AraC-like DNA-binding protein/quercetin dioxygenase-like cupin family protein
VCAVTVESCSTETDLKQRELKNHGTPMFPCGGYQTEIGGSGTRVIPWHWHEEFEVIAVKSGVLKVDIPQQTMVVRAGEAVFINAGVLQTVVNAGAVCEIHTLVFSPRFIFGDLESAIAQKYIRPLTQAVLRLMHFDQETHQNAVHCINAAFAAFEQKAFGYELLVRNALSKLLFLIVSENKNALPEQDRAKDTAIARTKEMLRFIDAHYQERITIDEIAGAAAVSGREALRCFKKALGTTPMNYLLRQRIAFAAGLLANGAFNITEICRLSGFESPSYFAMKFKAFTGMTPRAYRNNPAIV